MLSNPSNHPDKKQPQPEFRYRPFVILLFAAILASIAGVAKSQEPATPPLAESPPTVLATTNEGQSIADPVERLAIELAPATKVRSVGHGSTRPKYAEVQAVLANFDADADPDGWRVQLSLRDSQDRHVVMRAQAAFELTTRIPTADFQNYVDANTRPLRWSMNVKFDDDGIARFKLPLQQRLRPVFGWSTFPQSDLRSANVRVYSSHYRRGYHYRRSSRPSASTQNDFRSHLDQPHFGELKVRVSVPTEGVFEAKTPVQIRPTVLIDTHWPNR